MVNDSDSRRPERSYQGVCSCSTPRSSLLRSDLIRVHAVRARRASRSLIALSIIALSSCAGARTYADPRAASVNARAPEQYSVLISTTKGDVTIDVTRAWAPLGADRFYNLVRSGFYDGQRISRVRPGFIAQWGLHTDPAIIAAWKNAFIPDDPPKESNLKGTIAFAFKDPNSRATQVYINLVDNTRLDPDFAVFGKVASGMDAVEQWYGGYGEESGGGLRGGLQTPIEKEGAAWLDRNYPLLDRIITARITIRR
jgi:homoserine O-acetyltransferase